MKKATGLILIFLLVLSFLGPSLSAVFVNSGGEALVAAIGFEEAQNGVTVFLETITVNSENPEAESTVSVTFGEGESVLLAYKSALKKAALRVQLGHCTTAVMAKSLKSERVKEVFDFLYDEEEINLNISVVSVFNVLDFLKQKISSTIAVGFWTSEVLSAEGDKRGINYQNRLYQIEAMRREKEEAFALPQFSQSGDGIISLLVFKENEIIKELSYNQIPFSKFVTTNKKEAPIK